MSLEEKLNEFIFNLKVYRSILIQEKYVDYILSKFTLFNITTGLGVTPNLAAWVITGNEKYLDTDTIGDFMEICFPKLKSIHNNLPKVFINDVGKEILKFTEDLILKPIEEIISLLNDD